MNLGPACWPACWLAVRLKTEQMSRIVFSITDPPEFVGPEVDTAVLEGDNITLVCASGVNGNPTPTISWMDNNGSAVSDRTGISGATTLSLTVSGVTRYQAGNWTCTAENSPGGTRHTAERQVSLTVVGKCVGYDFPILWCHNTLPNNSVITCL